MASVSCCAGCSEKNAPQIFHSVVDGKPTEFLCCGKKNCAQSQLQAATKGKCCWKDCANAVDLDYTLPIFVRADECTSGLMGCSDDCQKHITQGSVWLFCGEQCMRISGSKDVNLGPVTRIQRCSGCDKQHVNSQKLKRCGWCRLAVYCDKSCQKKHWNEGHRSQCKKKK
jgi:hypothetical protein